MPRNHSEKAPQVIQRNVLRFDGRWRVHVLWRWLVYDPRFDAWYLYYQSGADRPKRLTRRRYTCEETARKKMDLRRVDRWDELGGSRQGHFGADGCPEVPEFLNHDGEFPNG